MNNKINISIVLAAGLLVTQITFVYAGCPTPCCECPVYQPDTPIEITYIRPDTKTIKICRQDSNPDWVHNAADWASYLNMAVCAKDYDIRVDHEMTIDEECECHFWPKPPVRFEETRQIVEWSGGVDLTKCGEYTLTAKVIQEPSPEPCNPPWPESNCYSGWCDEDEPVIIDFKITVYDIRLVDPQPDFVCQGHTKQMSIAPGSGCPDPVQWSVEPSQYLGITETGCVFFKPYGDSMLSFAATVMATVGPCFDWKSFDVKAPYRPCGHETIYPQNGMNEPPWNNCFHLEKGCLNNEPNCCKSASLSADYGVRYQCSYDECDAKVRGTFKVHFYASIVTKINPTWDVWGMGSPRAAARVLGTLGETVAINDARGCANEAGVTVAIPPQGSFSLADQAENIYYIGDLPLTVSDDHPVNHGPSSEYQLIRGATIMAGASTQNWPGWNVMADAYIGAWITDVNVVWYPIDPLSCN